MLSDTIPAPTLPTPTAPTPWSIPPATTRTDVGRPSSAAAAAESVPATSPGSMSSGSRSGPIPTASSIGGHQSRDRMSYSSDVHQTPPSETNRPVSRWRMRSSTRRNRRAAAKRSGSLRRSQRILHAGHVGKTLGTPVAS